MKQTIFIRTRSRPLQRVGSDDGLIQYALHEVAGKLAVERVQARRGASRVEQVSLFSDWGSFERWCDADALRFDYPLVHTHLKRHGAAILSQR
jgi:hypothetical protein